MALYRKYRPATFAEVVGQEHVTEPLSTALDTGRINHAYLFSGPRGCGKTSSARILARSLNCEQGPTASPCGRCESCEALAPGGPGNLDVIELDAASHGGVDDTRELRDRAFYAPATSRYRVFIVDEAHMVTTAGFNALLKIVEEPPAHLIFIFATTEPDKVLPTIRSRTHHYPFRLLPPATMRGLLGRICEQESVAVEEAVYPLVIRAGGGSPRDSLSVLDQLLAGAGDEGVTYHRAVSLLGVTDVALIDDAVTALAGDDGAALFGTIDRVMEAGHDPRRFAVDLLERFRDLILLQAVPDAVERGLVSGPGDVLDRMRDQAESIGPAGLTRFAELLHEGLGEMRGATAPRLLLEVVCARMLLPAASDSEAATLQRIERLERSVASGGALPAAPVQAGQAAEAAAAPVARPSAGDLSRRRGAEAIAALRQTKGKDAAPVTTAQPSAERSPSEAGAPSASAEVPVPPRTVESASAQPAAPHAEPSASAPDARVASPVADPRSGASSGASSIASPARDLPVTGEPTTAPPHPVTPDPHGSTAGGTGDARPDDHAVGAGGSSPSGGAASVRDSAAQPAPTGGAPAARQDRQPDIAAPVAPEPQAPAGSPEEVLQAVDGAWAQIRAKVREYGSASIPAMLSGASVVRVEGQTIVFAHPTAVLVGRLSEPRNVEVIRSAIREVLGVDYEVRWEGGSGARPQAQAARSKPSAAQADRAGQSGTPQGRGGQPAPAQAKSGRQGGVPQFSRPSRAGAEGSGAAGSARPKRPGPMADDDIPPPDFPDLPDDPGPGDFTPPDLAQFETSAPGEYAPPAVPGPLTAEEEQEMLAEAATPVAPEDRRDPDEVALELLRAELGATRLDG